MRILYAAGNRAGADTQLYRFLQHNQDKYEIKIAAYLKSSESINHIDWTLDPLINGIHTRNPIEIINIFGHNGIPPISVEETKLLIDEIIEFEPELIISDGEPICANIAMSFNTPLWYCSPIFLLNGVDWDNYKLNYIAVLEKHRRLLERFPKAEHTFIYSPFGDLECAPPLRKGFHWISPYTIEQKSNGDEFVAVIKDNQRTQELEKILNCLPQKINLFSPTINKNYNNLKKFKLNNYNSYIKSLSRSKYFFGTGETSYLSDVIFSNIFNIGISPDLDDLETIMNALACRACKVGLDLNKVELLGTYALETLEKIFVDQPKWQFKKERPLKIGEMLDEYARRLRHR